MKEFITEQAPPIARNVWNELKFKYGLHEIYITLMYTKRQTPPVT